MSHSYRTSLITSTSALAIALAAPSAAWAQDAQQAQSVNRLEEITVTARRIEEDIQSVAVAVSVFSEDKLNSQSIIGLKDFQKVTTAFNVVTDTGDYAFMRGLQGIVTFFADAPYTLKSSGQLFDVGNVQVLKGPQGTLFGASSVSGVFVMNPKKPSNNFEGFAEVTVGDYGRRTIGGAINIPVVDDKLMVRVAAQSWYRKGYVTDIDTGKDYFDQNYYIIRPSFIIKPTENLENYTMVHYFYERNNGRVDNIYNYDPFGAYGLFTTPGRADQLLALHQKDIYALQGLAIAAGMSGQKQRQINIVNNTRWDITDNLAFVNIFMWRTNGFRNVTDGLNEGFIGVPSNDPRAVATRTGPLNMQKTWSDEAKIQGTLFDDMINFTLGTFHSGNPAKNEISWDNTFGFLNASKTSGDIRNPAHVRAIFGQADVDLGRLAPWAEGLTFTAGYRYTWNTQISARTDYVVLPGVPTSQLKSARDLYGKAHFADDNWLFGLRYQVTPDTMLYVTGSKGVTTGQINPQNPDPYKLTQPEKLVQIEGGIKSTFFVGDMQFRTNFAAFYGWYSDIQSTLTAYVQVAPPPAPPQTLVISANSAEGLTRGIDADFAIIPVEWFELSGAASYNKNKYTKWPIFNPDGSFKLNRTRPFLGAPRLKWTLTGTYNVPMDEANGKLSISATFAHTSKNWYYASTFTEFGTDVHISTFTQANGYGPLASNGSTGPRDFDYPFHNLDLDVKWVDTAGVDGLTTTFGITNVLKNEGGYGTGYAWYAAGFLWNDPPPPRMFTVTMKYAF